MSKSNKKPSIKYDAKRVTTDTIIDWYVEHKYPNQNAVWKMTHKDQLKQTHELNDAQYQKYGFKKARQIALEDVKRAEEMVLDPEGYALKIAKREANTNTPTFNRITELNNKIDKKGFKATSIYLGQDANGMDVEVIGYYDIKNSDKVLAQVATENPYSRSPVVSWQFVDKDLI